MNKYEKFKKLLEWFVYQQKINGKVIDGTAISGQGYKGQRIRDCYNAWREYDGYNLDISMQVGYAIGAVSNYIHYDWVNVLGIYRKYPDGKCDIIALKIVVKPEKQVKNVYEEKTLRELGLFDDNEPNQELRDFFDKFEEEIKKRIEEIKNQIPKPEPAEPTFDDRNDNEVLPKNIILYGPPGTGKTYNTIDYAIKIIDSKFYNEHKNNREDLIKKFNELKEKGQIDFITFHQSYGYEEFIEGIRPIMGDQSGQTIKYEIKPGKFKSFCERKISSNDFNNEQPNKVFIIDEINRGNIAKIFGELITLIEDSKRIGCKEELKCILPYSGTLFGIPNNVYILGTMNTADRSISLIDTALRRRFHFIEMMPSPELLKDVVVEGINISKLLTCMNERIEFLFDREHQIGHSYFISLREKGNNTINALSNIFKNNIIPLLQEYFYDDYEKIRLVLGDNQKTNGEPKFIEKKPYNTNMLFGQTDSDIDDKECYLINEDSFDKKESYKYLVN